MARRGFKIADAYVDIHANKDTLREDIRNIGTDVDSDADAVGHRVGKKIGDGAKTELDKAGPEAGKQLGDGIDKGADPVNRGRTTGKNYAKGLLPEADTGGRAYGDKLSQGMNLAIVRNSPLIVAGIGAALAAGGPVVLAASAIAFGGIGVALASQDDNVRSAWSGLWGDLKSGASEDASVLADTVERMAGRFDFAFQSLRPQMQDIFGNSTPLVTMFGDALIHAGQNAMPGFVHSVEGAQPVMSGFDSFLSKIGTGLTGFFDNITAHAPSAGVVFSQLGDTIGTLLPMLGDLVGHGTELARTVLPVLNGTLSVFGDVLHVVGPALPIVTTGLLGFKAAGAASGYLKTLSQDLAFASYSSSPFAGAMGKASTAVSKVAGSLPALGAVLGVVLAGFEAYNQTVDQWANALLQGGAAADKAREQMGGLGDVIKAQGPVTRALADAFGATGEANLLGAKAADAARQKYRDQLAAMDPLTRAQTLQKQALNDLNNEIGKYGPNSDQAAAAADRYAKRTAEAERAQHLEEMAIRGVTQAMLEQAAQADSRANSDLAYREAVLSTTEAIKNLHETQKTAKAGSAELAQASNDVEAAMIRQVEAAGKLAQDALPSTTDANQKAALAAQASLKEFDQLAKEFGGPLPENLQRYRDDLARAAGQMDLGKVSADTLRDSLKQVGLTVTEIPGTKEVRITAPTDAVIQGLEKLGFTVTAIPGTKDVAVSADTDAAKRNLGEIEAELSHVGGLTPTPTVDANPVPFNTVLDYVTSSIHTLAAQKPTPIADLNPSAFSVNWSSVMGNISLLNGQRPTPVAGLADGPFQGAAGSVNSMLSYIAGRSVYPSATLIANTLAAEQSINYTARDRTVHIATVYNPAPVGAGARPVATGGSVGRVLGAPGFAAGRSPMGQISGPGGPTDDLILAVNEHLQPLRVSNLEWIVNAGSSQQYGTRRMGAVNDGTADVRAPGEPGYGRSSVAVAMAPAAAGPGIVVQAGGITLSFPNVLSIGDSALPRQLIAAIEQGLIQSQRERS